jgi:hypothetical protein
MVDNAIRERKGENTSARSKAISEDQHSHPAASAVRDPSSSQHKVAPKREVGGPFNEPLLSLPLRCTVAAFYADANGEGKTLSDLEKICHLDYIGMFGESHYYGSDEVVILQDI